MNKQIQSKRSEVSHYTWDVINLTGNELMAWRILNIHTVIQPTEPQARQIKFFLFDKFNKL